MATSKSADQATMKTNYHGKLGDLGIKESTWANINQIFNSPDALKTATDRQLEAIEGVTKADIQLIREEVGGPE